MMSMMKTINIIITIYLFIIIIIYPTHHQQHTEFHTVSL